VDPVAVVVFAADQTFKFFSEIVSVLIDAVPFFEQGYVVGFGSEVDNRITVSVSDPGVQVVSYLADLFFDVFP
jgi:hypothetical protein